MAGRKRLLTAWPCEIGYVLLYSLALKPVIDGVEFERPGFWFVGGALIGVAFSLKEFCEAKWTPRGRNASAPSPICSSFYQPRFSLFSRRAHGPRTAISSSNGSGASEAGSSRWWRFFYRFILHAIYDRRRTG